MLADMNLAMGEADKAKMFGEFAVAYFPDSAEAYRALADYYQHSGDEAQARRLLSKARDLSGKKE